MIKCIKCMKFKEIDCFGPTKQNSNGLKSTCKECLSLAEKERRARDPEMVRALEKAWRENNLDRAKATERKAGAKRRESEGYRNAKSMARHDLKLEKHKDGKSDVACAVCGVHFCPLFGKHSWINTCSDRCRKISDDKRVRIKVSAYRARKRGVRVEPVDPLRVFVRDRYICQLCGDKTLKSKRGTNHPRAPELDHIKPLSAGGEHSYRNTQCACRLCNGVKSNRAVGQLRLCG